MPMIEGDVTSDVLPQEGEVIYEGQPRFLKSGSDMHFAVEREQIAPPVADGEVIYESDNQAAGMIAHGDGCECGGDTTCGMSGDCGSCGSWDGCGSPDCDECIPLCLPRFRFLTLFGGVQGFKGARDNGTGCNFGFHEGINIAGRAPFIGWRGIGYQLGYRATQSRLHGDLTSSEGRMQSFVTGGLFRRTPVGLQGGVAYDLLRDDLIEEVDFSQLRTELSILGPRGGELGFAGMFHVNSQTIGNTVFESADQFLLFFRKRFDNCGEGRLWAGFTDTDDGIFGGELLLPLDDRWSAAGTFTYLIPEDDAPPQGAIDEAWNIGLSLVWHWRCQARSSQNTPFRPLFGVADNGSMIIVRP
jgi:hypothetical protein